MRDSFDDGENSICNGRGFGMRHIHGELVEKGFPKSKKRMEGLETSPDLDKEIAQRTNQSLYRGCSQHGVQHPYWQTNQKWDETSTKNVKRDDELMSDGNAISNSAERMPQQCS